MQQLIGMLKDKTASVISATTVTSDPDKEFLPNLRLNQVQKLASTSPMSPSQS